jgi:serine protease Do
MNWFRKSLTGTVIFGAAAASAFVATGLVKDVQFAGAQQEVETTREQLAHVEGLATVFREVGKVVEPSVVNIRVTKGSSAASRRLPFNDDMLRRFFPDRDGDGEPDLPEEFGNPAPMEGTGSGVIMEVVDGSAFIVTNNHVAGNASEMVVTLADGRTIDNATLVGADSKTDIAVLKIEADRLISAKWGDSDKLQKGDWIMAFGSPMGYIGSMTHGIVSALNRTNVGILGSMGYENFIQVDAPINPGNSGGPLVNVRGEVVGINTAIASVTGGFQGIGFAIPSNQAKVVYQQLKDKGKIVRGYLGIEIDDVAKPKTPRTEMALESVGYEGKEGVFVHGTQSDAPASGKLQPGDVITKLNGKEVGSVQELRNTVASMAPGTDVKVGVVRYGKDEEVTVTIGEQPEEVASVRGGRNREPGRGEATGVDALGIRLGTLTEELAQKHGVSGTKAGAVITEIAPGSPGQRMGLSVGDVITRVGKTPVSDAKEASEALSKADLEKGIAVHVTNREGSRLLTVQTSGNGALPLPR